MKILRNAAAQLVGLPVSWALSFIFLAVVPRALGPGELGRWSVAWAVCLVARSVLDTGTTTVLWKDISRRPERASVYLSSAIALRILLTVPLLLGVAGFARLAGYAPQTRLVLLLIALATAVNTVAAAATFTLQALERMHINAIAGVLNNAVLSGLAVLVVLAGYRQAADVAWVAVVAAVVAAAYQFWKLRDLAPHRARPEWQVIRHYLVAGVPYAVGAATLSLYVWIDGILLSMMATSAEVGQYGAATQLIATMGFLPSAVSAAVFPTLARNFLDDRERMVAVAERSLRILIMLSLPMAAGLALTARSLVSALYGNGYGPTAVVLEILAVTLVPVYIATLLGTVMVTNDRQNAWTWMTAGLAVANIGLNLILIPSFHRVGQHGGYAAATAVLITDLATAVGVLVLASPAIRGAVARCGPDGLRSLLATLGMAALVWPVRDQMFLIPVAVGAAAYVCLGGVLRVVPPAELEVLKQVLSRTAARMTWRRRLARVESG